MALLAQPDPRLVEILARMEHHLEERLTNTDNRLTTIEDNFQDLSTIVCHLPESSPSPVISAPIMMQDVLEGLIQDKFNATYQTTIDSISRLSASIA